MRKKHQQVHDRINERINRLFEQVQESNSKVGTFDSQLGQYTARTNKNVKRIAATREELDTVMERVTKLERAGLRPGVCSACGNVVQEDTT